MEVLPVAWLRWYTTIWVFIFIRINIIANEVFMKVPVINTSGLCFRRICGGIGARGIY